MLSEFGTFLTTIAVIGTAATIAFVMRKRRLDAPFVTHDPKSPALDAALARFRDGGIVGFNASDKVYDQFHDHSFPHRGERVIGKHPALGMGYAAAPRKRSIFLTPRQLERVNIQRKLRNRQPLNRAGFSNAVAHAWDQPQRQPDNTGEWLLYLLYYDCLFADHTTSRVSVDTGLTITPEAPYNGHGGEFAGAGASGQWMGPDASTGRVAAAIAGMDPLSDPNSYKGSTDTQPDRDKYQPGDHVGGYGDGGYPQSAPSDPASNGPGPSYTDLGQRAAEAPIFTAGPGGEENRLASYADLGQQAATYTPDPSPASAPDPSPSYSPDPSPSAPSFDSSPSPSFDTPSFDPGTSTI